MADLRSAPNSQRTARDKRLAELSSEIEHMGAAIAAGLFPPTLKSKLEAAGRVDGIGSGGVPWTNAIVPLFAQKRPSDNILAPTRCGNGHALTPGNLVLAERGTRWRCRQCGIDRAATWRRRRYTAA